MHVSIVTIVWLDPRNIFSPLLFYAKNDSIIISILNIRPDIGYMGAVAIALLPHCTSVFVGRAAIVPPQIQIKV